MPKRALRVIVQSLCVVGSKGVVVRVGGSLRKVAPARVVGRAGARRVEALVAPCHFDGAGAAGPVRQIALVERRCPHCIKHGQHLCQEEVEMLQDFTCPAHFD